MITIRYDYVLLIYICILAISWIISEQTNKYLVLFELVSLLILVLICDWKWKENKERKEKMGVEK